MFLSIFYYLLTTVLILFLTLVTLIITITVYLKLKLEPVKGVCKSDARLDGKTALVTGGNAGIGLETAKDLARRGAKVIIACRDARRSAEAIADIKKTTGNENIEFRPLDLANFQSIRKFAEDFNKSYDRLHILVNNAGCAALKPKPSVDGIDVVMQINYLGPFLLTNLLLDKMIMSKPSRIIIVSSYLHNFGRVRADKLDGLKIKSSFLLYSNSKLCDVLWMKALAKRLPVGVTVNSLHPGIVKTDIFRRIYPAAKNILLPIIDLVFKTPIEGAQTTIHLCVSKDVEHISGKYFMECKEAEYYSLADDDELVEKVWEKSLSLTR